MLRFRLKVLVDSQIKRERRKFLQEVVMSAFLPNPKSVTSKRSIAVFPALGRLDATAVDSSVAPAGVVFGRPIIQDTWSGGIEALA